MVLVNVYVNDYDYSYNKSFIIKGGKEEKEKILAFKEYICNLDSEDLENEFKKESTIEIIEDYIEKNYEIVKYEELSLDMY